MASKEKLRGLQALYGRGDLSDSDIGAAQLTPDEERVVRSAPQTTTARGSGSEEGNTIASMPWYEKLDKGFEHGLEKVGQGTLQGLYHLGTAVQKGFGVEPKSPTAEWLGLPKNVASMDKYIRKEGKKREPYDKHGGGWYTTGDVVGTALATAPLLAIPGGKVIGHRALSGGGVGAGVMATQPVTGKNYALEKSQQLGLGAGIGATVGVVLPPVIEKAVEWVAKAGRGIIKTVKSLRGHDTIPSGDRKIVDEWMREAGIELDHLGAEAKESFYKSIAEQLRSPAPATESARVAVESARRLPYKVDLTKGQITKSFEDVGKESRLGKIDYLGAPLRDRKMEQNEAIVKSLEHLREKIAPVVHEAEDIGSRYSTFTENRLRDLQTKEVTPAYNEILKTYGDDYVPLGSVTAKIKELEMSGAVDLSPKIRNVVERLQTWVNMSRDPKAFTMGGTSGPQAQLTVKQAENYRRTVGEFAKDSSPTEGKYIGELMDSLEDDIINSVGADVYAPARKVAQSRFTEKSAYEQAFSKSTADMVRKVKLMREPELREWANIMKGTTEGHGLYNATRGRILEDIIEKSLNKSQVDALGFPMFDQRAFTNGVKNLGKRRREVLFSPQENQIIDDIVIVGQRRVPMRDATNPSGTAQELFNMIGSLMRTIPFSGFVANVLKATVGKVLQPIGHAFSGNTGKAVQEVLNPFKNPLRLNPKSLKSRGVLQGGVVSAQQLQGDQ